MLCLYRHIGPILVISKSVWASVLSSSQIFWELDSTPSHTLLEITKPSHQSWFKIIPSTIIHPLSLTHPEHENTRNFFCKTARCQWQSTAQYSCPVEAINPSTTIYSSPESTTSPQILTGEGRKGPKPLLSLYSRFCRHQTLAPALPKTPP